MEIIRKWLSGGQSYEEGVALYCKYGNNLLLKKLFTSEEWSDFKEKKLVAALKELLQPATTAKAAIVAPMPSISRQKGWPVNMDKVLQALWNKWKPLYSEMMNQQARIYDIALLGKENNDNVRRQQACTMAHSIIDLDEQIEEIYTERDYYMTHGHLQEHQAPEIIGDPVRWATKLANAERYTRAFKIKVKDDPANVKAAATLKKHEDDVARYRKLLKLDL